MQQYDFQAVANASFPIASQGRYLKYLSGNNGGGDVSIVATPQGQGATKIVLVPGQAVRLPMTGAEPAGWILSNNAGGATIKGTVVIGNGEIDDPTINGTVQVVDGSKARALGNTAFSGFAYGPYDATHYDQNQLWNPATNPNRLVVEAIYFYATQSSNAYIASSTAALGTLCEYGQPKKLGGSVSQAQLCGGDTTVAPPTSNDLGSFSIVASQPQAWIPHEPIIIPPGYGLLITNNVLNNNMTTNFEWYEEPNV